MKSIFKFFKSLQAKYLLIIVIALFFIQISLIFSGLILMNTDVGDIQEDYHGVEKRWHQDAENIDDMSKETVMDHFRTWKEAYPQASMFWVNDDGKLTEELDTQNNLPAEWDAAYTAQFIKERYDGNPFTVAAFLGEEENHGFIVLELPRDVLNGQNSDRNWIYMGTFFLLLIVFMIVSLLFFRRIRKRLLNLQTTMDLRDEDNLPVLTHVRKDDEIGELETAFNKMVSEQRESREREQQEEQLRRELIANISHDLRTPLTKMRAQTNGILKEDLSDEGREAIQSVDESIDSIDRLVENLMSYTLLTASKLTYQPERTDIIRYARSSMASWYPLFEQENFYIDVRLEPFENNEWLIDPFWMDRIFDNLLQNVIRHAKDGRYIGVSTEATPFYDAIVMTDHGRGMSQDQSRQGAGIGMSIIDLMIQQMNLDWDVTSNSSGTAVRIKRLKKHPAEENNDH